jgi:hypothetical protein
VRLLNVFGALSLITTVALATGCSQTSSFTIPKGVTTTGTTNFGPVQTGVNNILVSWAASHASSVNKAGGGYRVYYSLNSGFSTSGALYVDVPYVSGATAPTSASIPNVGDGKYYIKIVAYSSLVGPSGGTESASGTSVETSVTVP